MTAYRGNFGGRRATNPLVRQALRLIDRRGNPPKFRCVRLSRPLVRVYAYNVQLRPLMA